MVNYVEIRKRCEYTIKPMVQEFDNIKGKLKDIAENVYPLAKQTLTDEVDQWMKSGEKHDDNKVLNTTPFDALRKGSAGFLVNLMNPALKWFHLEPRRWIIEGADDDGQTSESEYLENLENFIFDLMSKSGSYRAFKKAYEHLLAFGFTCVLVHQHKDYICKAQCLPIGTYALGIGEDGKVNRVNRRFAMTAEELVREFGCGERGLDALPADVIENWKRGNHSKDGNYIVECLIEPNEPTWACGSMEKLDYGLPKNAKYRSIYWLRGRTATNRSGGTDDRWNSVLSIRGFKFNPIIAPRLDCELGGVYGRGRGHDALNACRALQALMFDQLEISSNRAEPPLLAANELREEGLDLSRGAVTYTNLGEQRSSLVTPILTNPPTSDETIRAAMEFEQKIKEVFFLSEFATIDSLKNINSGDKRTAAEINALKSENMLQLGGIVLMLEDEFLDPCVNIFTEYAIASKAVRYNGWSDAKPKAGDLIPRYVGNLQLAQRTQELNSTENSINFALDIAGFGAKLQYEKAFEVLDNFDYDKIIRTRHRLVGGSDRHLLNKENVNQIRMQRQRAAEEAAEAQRQEHEAAVELQRMKSAAQSARANESQMKANMLGGDMVAAMSGEL
jgi:hypothetical protein